MPGERTFLPRKSAAGAIRDVSRPVQKGGGQAAIGATVEVDHVVHVLSRVAVHEKPGTGGTPLLALLGIAREPRTRSRVADGKIEPVAEPDTQRPIRPGGALGSIVVLGPWRWLVVLARASKDQIEPIGVD